MDLASARRTQRLRLAVLSSTCSKISGFGLQALCLPLVFHSLSTHDYAIFLLVSAVLSTLNLTQMGAGPGLTQEIAKAFASSDRAAEAEFFGAAVAFSVSIIVIAGASLSVLLRVLPTQTLLGAAYVADHGLIVATGNVCIVLVCAHILFGNVDSALAAYQDQVFTSVGSFVSNIVSAILIVYVCDHDPSITAVILVTFAPLTASRVANLLLLFWRRPYLASRIGRASWTSLKRLLGSGLAFWLVQLSSVVEQNAGIFLLGRFSTPANLATFGVVFKAITLAMSVVSVITQPLWPAYIDARLRGDLPWIRRLFQRSRSALIVIAAALSMGLVSLGRYAFATVLHADLGPDGQTLLLVFALYLSLNIWSHLHYMSLMGLGSVWRIALVVLIENAIVLGLGLALVPLAGMTGMALAYLLASLAVPAWYLPILMGDTLRGLAAQQPSSTDPGDLLRIG